MSVPISATPATKPQPVLVFMSIMTALTAISGALAVSDLVSEKVAGFLILVVAAINQGVAYYVKGQVVPYQDVATYVNDQRITVTGPAHVVTPPEAPTTTAPEPDEPFTG